MSLDLGDGLRPLLGFCIEQSAVTAAGEEIGAWNRKAFLGGALRPDQSCDSKL